MGLGKTFQVIAFLHTILTHPKISKVVRRVMIVGPKNVVTNWSREFTKWLADVDPLLNTINVYRHFMAKRTNLFIFSCMR